MKSRIILSLVFSLLLTGSLSAATDFTGAVDNLWSNPDNWSAGIPNAGDPAAEDTSKFKNDVFCVLDYAAPPVSNLNMQQGASHLQLVDGAVLTCNSWNAIAYNGGEEDNRHLLEVLGGVMDLHSHIRVGRLGYGHLVIDYTGVVNLHDSTFRVGYDTNGDGLVSIRGGSLNLLTDNALPLNFRNGTNSKAQVDFSGGVMTQAYSDERLAFVNDYIADGTITAYDGVGTVIVDTGDPNDFIHVSGLHPFNPVPADSTSVVYGPITLEWTVDAGTVVDVWFTDDVDKIYAVNPDALLIAKQAITSVQVTAEKDTRYFWAVDTYAPGATEPSFGPVFDFLAVANFPPEVTAGEDVTTWLENGSVTVTLAGTVNEAADTTWTLISEPDDPNNPEAVIADPTALNTTITLSALGEYVLQLDANDGEKDAEPSQMTINVYADSCLAAQSLPDYVALPGDIDGDCDVDQDDLDLLMADWLKCVALGGCNPNDPNAL